MRRPLPWLLPAALPTAGAAAWRTYQAGLDAIHDGDWSARRENPRRCANPGPGESVSGRDMELPP